MNEFDDVRVTPDPGYAKQLEELLVSDLGWSSDTEGRRVHRRRPRRRRHEPGARRSFVTIAAAVMVVALLGVSAGLVARRERQTVVAEMPAHGPLAAGTHRTTVMQPAVRITTTAPWDVTYVDGSSFLLSRGDTENTGLLLIRDPRGQHTVEGASSSICAGGDIDFGPPQATTLLGAPALRRDGVTTDLCVVWTYFGPMVGDRVISVVADVRGTIYMVVASGPAAQWPALSAEFDAMIASLDFVQSG